MGANLAPDSRSEAGSETWDLSHRWFGCAGADWPQFLELAQTAWDNFEEVHDTHGVGFWRSLTPPAPGQIWVWLMAWYRDLASWDRSRFWNRDQDPAARAAHERFRARRPITADTAVSIVERVV